MPQTLPRPAAPWAVRSQTPLCAYWQQARKKSPPVSGPYLCESSPSTLAQSPVSAWVPWFPVNSYPIPTRTKSTRTQYQLVPKLTRTHCQLVPIQLVPKSTRTQFVLILSVRLLCSKNKPGRMQLHRVIMYYLISVDIWLQLM